MQPHSPTLRTRVWRPWTGRPSAIYFLSAALMLAMAVTLGRLLPPDRIPKARVPYTSLVFSVVTLAARDRTFRVRALLGLLMFSGFGAVWG